VDHLKHIQDVSNKSLLRSTGFTPAAALKLDKAGRATLRERVLRSQEEGGQLTLPDYPVGLAVRVKVPKNILQKSTTPSWSSVIYKVLQAYRGRTPMEATRYRISKPKSNDLRSNRYDLQPVIGGPPVPIPGSESSDDDEDDDGDVAAVAKAKADKAAKAAENKKGKEDADTAIIEKYRGKRVRAPDGEGENGKVVAVARRRIKGRKQWRVQVKWPDIAQPRWYSRAQIDENVLDDKAG
jgi:hypothetical protein